MNEYEPTNALQKEYDDLQKGCTCTMRESCHWCDLDASEQRRIRRNEIIEQCISTGYQLYQKGFHAWEKHYPIDYDYWKDNKVIVRKSSA